MLVQQARIEFRKVFGVLWAFPFMFLVYILRQPRPLTSEDPLVFLVAVFQGLMLALILFTDSEKVSAFLFSRAISRRQLFMVRWSLGIAMQAVTLLVVFLVIVLKTRWALHRGDALEAYYPMVSWYELRVLWPMGIYSILAYEIAMFLKVRQDLLRPNRRKKRLPWLPAALLAAVIAALVAAGTELFHGSLAPSGMLLLWPFWAILLGYTLLVSALATIASAHCYEHVEVEA